MYEIECESCESLLLVNVELRNVVHGENVEEMTLLHDLGLVYECPVCGYEVSVLDEFQPSTINPNK